MFDTSRRLSALEADVAALRAMMRELDIPELERMRASVLNALRAHRRSITAAEARTGNGQGSNGGPDEFDRLLAIRRGGG